MNNNHATQTNSKESMEDDILRVVAAYRAYGKDNAQNVFNGICRDRNLKKFEQIILVDRIIKRL